MNELVNGYYFFPPFFVSLFSVAGENTRPCVFTCLTPFHQASLRLGHVAGCTVGAAGSIFKPAFQRRLAFARWLAEDQVLDADILVQLRPEYSTSTPNQPPVGSLVKTSVAKTRIPRQRSGDRSTVGELHGQQVLSNRDGRCANMLCVSY